ncbi:54S ribosomal protein img2, mitochondrial [Ceratocystis pirilliformis]|uniref:Large ribosomal subunit protein mL49 n=1 Tax=Ceratocystis pirilliformis TaxID=259994 RepID=A0ABR3ZGJ6_9PEZI
MLSILRSAHPAAALLPSFSATVSTAWSARTYATETIVVSDVLARDKPAVDPTQKTYSVLRTASKNLPVYLDQNRASKTFTTIIRRIEGSPQDLKKDLYQALELPAEDVKVNPVTKHIHAKVLAYSPFRHSSQDRILTPST